MNLVRCKEIWGNSLVSWYTFTKHMRLKSQLENCPCERVLPVKIARDFGMKLKTTRVNSLTPKQE